MLRDRPFAIMGVVNVTPDSFFDGGRYDTAALAVRHARSLVEEGADLLDIGGESTRPGALPVSETEECRRVIPVIRKLARSAGVPLSIDTSKAAVARRAFDAGAALINDVSAGRNDPGMAALAARRRCPVVLMHSRQTPRDMQQAPRYGDVLREVRSELLACVRRFLDAGVRSRDIILDPGIGFAKRLEDNLALLRRPDVLLKTGFPVLIGPSRKSFIGAITGKEPRERLAGTLAAVAAAYVNGARFFRVHDVKETRDLLMVLSRIQESSRPAR